MPYSWKTPPGGNFRQFRHLLSLAKFCPQFFLSHVNDYIEDMTTFTALVKIEYFCDTKVAGLGEIFVGQKFLAVHYMYSGPLWFIIALSSAHH